MGRVPGGVVAPGVAGSCRPPAGRPPGCADLDGAFPILQEANARTRTMAAELATRIIQGFGPRPGLLHHDSRPGRSSTTWSTGRSGRTAVLSDITTSRSPALAPSGPVLRSREGRS